MKSFKDILSEARKTRGKFDHIQIPEHRQEEYDQHYDKLYDRGGLTHDQIHERVLRLMNLI